MPKLDDFEQFNEGLVESCRQELNRQVRGKPDTKAGMLEEDRRAMLPLPENAFEAQRIEPCQANSLSLVRFDRNDYSVPTEHAHHAVVARGGIPRPITQPLKWSPLAAKLVPFLAARNTVLWHWHKSQLQSPSAFVSNPTAGTVPGPTLTQVKDLYRRAKDLRSISTLFHYI